MEVKLRFFVPVIAHLSLVSQHVTACPKDQVCKRYKEPTTVTQLKSSYIANLSAL